MKKEKPSVVVAEVGLDYVYVSNSEVGKIDSAFKHNTDIPWVVEMQDAIKQLKNERARDNAVIKELLKFMGVNTKNSYTPMALLCKSIFTAKVVLNGQTAYGIEMDSMNEYMKKVIRLDGVLNEMPEHPTFMHKVDGEWEFDEEKYNALQVVL